jgi:hypothetical protein
MQVKNPPVALKAQARGQACDDITGRVGIALKNVAVIS